MLIIGAYYQNIVSSFIGCLTYHLPFFLWGLAGRIPLNVLRNHHQKLAGLNSALSLPVMIAVFNYVNMTPNFSAILLSVIWYMAKYHSLPLTVILEPRLPTRWLFWIHQVNGKLISICRCLYIEIWMKFIKYYMKWCNDRCQDFKD